jgi:biopolymer transport protein ExbB
MRRWFTLVCLLLLGSSHGALALELNDLGELWGVAHGLQWFGRGGPIMFPILACSIIGLAIFLERLAFLRRKHLLPVRFVRNVTRAWQRGEIDLAWRLCEQHDVPLARILRAGLLKAKESPQEVERAIETTGSHEAAVLASNLRFLGAIANIAPMLGFLGTVTGLISAFNVIAVHGTGDPKLLADGVSEALITTEFGLFVGIPALGAYHYLRGKVERLVHELEGITLELLSAIPLSRPKPEEGEAL